jgi:hypothetical protein
MQKGHEEGVRCAAGAAIPRPGGSPSAGTAAPPRLPLLRARRRQRPTPPLPLAKGWQDRGHPGGAGAGRAEGLRDRWAARGGWPGGQLEHGARHAARMMPRAACVSGAGSTQSPAAPPGQAVLRAAAPPYTGRRQAPAAAACRPRGGLLQRLRQELEEAAAARAGQHTCQVRCWRWRAAMMPRTTWHLPQGPGPGSVAPNAARGCSCGCSTAPPACSPCCRADKGIAALEELLAGYPLLDPQVRAGRAPAGPC